MSTSAGYPPSPRLASAFVSGISRSPLARGRARESIETRLWSYKAVRAGKMCVCVANSRWWKIHYFSALGYILLNSASVVMMLTGPSGAQQLSEWYAITCSVCLYRSEQRSGPVFMGPTQPSRPAAELNKCDRTAARAGPASLGCSCLDYEALDIW